MSNDEDESNPNAASEVPLIPRSRPTGGPDVEEVNAGAGENGAAAAGDEDARRSAAMAQFVEVTQVESAMANEIMETCGWNLEAAIAMALGGATPGGLANRNAEQEVTGRATSHVRQRATDRANSTATAHSSIASYSPRLSVASARLRRGSVTSWCCWPSMARLLGISSRCWRMVKSLLSFAINLAVRPFVSQVTTSPHVIAAAIDHSDNYFAHFFVEKYGNHSPRFTEGSFQDVLRTASSRGTLLVVYLHREGDQASDDFARQVLCDPRVTEALNSETSFTLWGSREEPDSSAALLEVLNVSVLPHLRVILPATFPHQPLAVLEGPAQASDAVSILAGAVMTARDIRVSSPGRSVSASVAEVQRHRAQADRVVMEEQDREYQAALRLDKERELQRQREEEEKLQAEQVREAERQRKEALSQRRREARLQLADSFRAEDEGRKLSPPDSSLTTRIGLRLPNGVRVERQFLKAERTARLHDWAQALEILESERISEAQIPDRFVLRVPMGPELDVSEAATLEEAGLVPNALLLLTPKDEEDVE